MRFFYLISAVIAGMVCFADLTWAATARVVIAGTTPESTTSGSVSLKEENGGLSVEATLAGLSAGKHGFHIHENGSCEDAGMAAGGHFNPDNVMHGDIPKDGMGHAHPGDMGNIDVAPNGTGSANVFLPDVTLKGGKYDVAGKAIIIHENQDDFSQPTGNAGGRIGCGIIPMMQAPGVGE